MACQGCERGEGSTGRCEPQTRAEMARRSAPRGVRRTRVEELRRQADDQFLEHRAAVPRAARAGARGTSALARGRRVPVSAQDLDASLSSLQAITLARD